MAELTSDFVGAFAADALVVELADLGFLAGGEREWVAGGERRGPGGDGGGAGWGHSCCHDMSLFYIGNVGGIVDMQPETETGADSRARFRLI